MVPDRISREVVIDAPPDVVWSIVTEPRHVARWFSDEAEIDLRPGGAMLLTWHRHGTFQARVETVDPPQHERFDGACGAGCDAQDHDAEGAPGERCPLDLVLDARTELAQA